MSVTVDRLVAEIEANPSGAIAALRAFDTVMDASARDRTSEMDVDLAGALAELARFETSADFATRDRTMNIDVDHHGSMVLSGLTSVLGGLAGAAEGAASAIGGVASASSGAVSGLASVASAGGGAGEALTSVASGAGGAGGGMSSMARGAAGAAGALAGVAQALGPILIMGASIASVLPGAFAAAAAGAGVLVAALAPLVGLLGAIVPAMGALALVGGTLFAGLSGVISGVQAYQGAAEGAGAATDDLRARQEGLRSAQQGLASAVRQVTVAQQELKAAQEEMAKAPLEAAEAIEDARFRSAQAALNEKKAILALQQAQKNLSDLQNAAARSTISITKQTDEFTGKVYEVASESQNAASSAEDFRQTQLALQQAVLDLAQAKDSNGDAQRDLNEMEKKGIKNSDIMVAARNRLSNAEWNLKQAHQGVASAQRQVAQAQRDLTKSTTAGTAAMDKWNEAQKRLTPTGIEFVKFIADEFLPALSGITDEVQDAMLPGIEGGLRALMTTFDEVEDELAIVGKMLGDTFEDFFVFWAKPKQQKILTEMFEALNDVLAAGLDLARPLSRVIVGLTTTASPMLISMLEGLGDGLDRLADWMESDKGKKKTTKFFDDAAHFGGLWLDVLSPIGGILSAIATAAKPLAEKWLVSMAESLEETSKWLNSKPGQDTIVQYLEDSMPALGELWGLLGDIRELLFETTSGGEDSAFYKTLVKIRELMPDLKSLFEELDRSELMPNIVDAVGSLVSIMENVDWEMVSDQIEKVANGFGRVAWFLDEIEGNPVYQWLKNIAENPVTFGIDTSQAQQALEAFWEWWVVFNNETLHNALTVTLPGWWNDFWQDVETGWITMCQSVEKDLKDWFRGLGKAIEIAAGDLFDFLPDSFQEAITDMKDQMVAFKDWLVDNVPDFTPWDGLVPSIGGDDQRKKIGMAEGKWSGGAVSAGRAYEVGEHGSELFIPSTSGRIMPAGPTKEMLESNGGGVTDAQLEHILDRVLDRARPNQNIEVSTTNEADPLHVAHEIAWSLS